MGRVLVATEVTPASYRIWLH